MSRLSLKSLLKMLDAKEDNQESATNAFDISLQFFGATDDAFARRGGLTTSFALCRSGPPKLVGFGKIVVYL